MPRRVTNAPRRAFWNPNGEPPQGQSERFRENENVGTAIAPNATGRAGRQSALGSRADGPGPIGLPRPATALVGRDQDVAAAVALLDREGVRLLTLTGPGGIGKTRLALRVAAELAAVSTTEVRFVALDALDDPALVAGTVARAFAVRDTGERPIPDVVAAAIGDRSLLLVLDNTEHLPGVGALAALLTDRCPGLRILATGRVPLRLPGERVVRVPPLPLPDLGALPDPEALAANPTVALFRLRARAVNPTFALTADNAAAVAHLCVRLDGVPLAIELAAARCGMLAPAALLARLDGRLGLLTGGPRDAPPRQRALRDTVAWSYRLLAPEVQTLFRRLAVFGSGFTAEAAEAIAGEGGTGGRGDGQTDGVLPVSIGIAALLDHGLLDEAAGFGTEPARRRYRMPETIRAYALERLKATGEEAERRRCHADWGVAFAERCEPELVGPDQQAWLDCLEGSRDNLRAAFSWLIANGEAESALRLAGALWRFWAVRGPLTEGQGWLERALALADARGVVSPDARAKVLHHLGNTAFDLGDFPRARAHYASGLAIRRWQQDRRGVASALNGLGLVALMTGALDEARRRHEESLALRRSLSDRPGEALALSNLGDVADAAGDHATAAALHARALAIREAAGDIGHVASSTHNLGAAAFGRGDDADARRRYARALALFEIVGDRAGIAHAKHGLARVAARAGRPRTAAAWEREALALRWAAGDRLGVAECLEGLAALAGTPGRATVAARLFGAAAALRRALGAPLPPARRKAHDGAVLRARRATDMARFRAAWDAGEAMPIADAVGEATALVAALIAPDPAPIASPVTGLTAREGEVVRLVAAGCTNAEIADRLCLSPHTVGAHLRRIYPKLGVATRGETTRFALAHGLG